ncbi:MAG: uroporphyrinogen decarboxylase family protein [Promethearchaeota archaeon]
MNSFDRVHAALKREPVDRPPVLPHMGDHTGIINGLSYTTMYTDAGKAAGAHLKALKLHRYDLITFQVEPSWPVVEACGAKIFFPPDKNPWIVKHVINMKRKISKN